MLRVTSAAASHPGLRRPENEDAHCVRPDLGLYLVADGMGGHVAGEVASRTVAVAIEQFIAETAAADAGSVWPFPYDTQLSRDANRLTMAIRVANQHVQRAIDQNETLRGMATTVAALLMGPEDGVVAHVGDSRVYRWREGHLEQLTQDHSWVSEQIRAGVLTETAARHHPWRNVVTRALTGGSDPVIDVHAVGSRPGDRLLACSDGLSCVVASEHLARLVGTSASPEDACRALIEAANLAGGPDNITVAVLYLDVA
jgi:protein phosphatase